MEETSGERNGTTESEGYGNKRTLCLLLGENGAGDDSHVGNLHTKD